MRRLCCATLIVAVLLVWATDVAAQNNVSRPTVRVIDPVELAGPPKKPPVISPAMRALADSSVMKVDAKDVKAVPGAVRELTSLLDRFPNEPDL